MIKRNFPSFLLYAFGFLLLWEWLRPIEQLTDTSHVSTFIIFVLIAILAAFFTMKPIWQFIIKSIFIVIAIYRFHYGGGFFHLGWVKSFLGELKSNLLFLFKRDWDYISNPFRTLLLFILLWLMVYLIQYWLLRRQRLFLFFFMTLVYITVLDTFTPYNAKTAIVRTVISGFAVMGMLTYFRISQKENVGRSHIFFRKWMVPLTGMIVFSVLIGVLAPKAAPVWPDPVPYLKGDVTKKDSSRANGANKVGYGTNDDHLGGPFIGDNNPVFSYEASGKNYWKVETKDQYTGKGWIASGATTRTFTDEELVPVFPVPESVETIQATARFFAYKDFHDPHFVYPAGIQKIVAFQPYDPNGTFSIDTNKEKIQFVDSKNRTIVPNLFTVDFVIPKYKASDLMKTTEYDQSVMNPMFFKRYTQLPDQVPIRVKQLAEQITAGKTNWFDKAKAIESYFSNADYSYDQKNVAYPADSQDYVDQFLFDTKRGYCDNFSTSMAVMLRTIGIPTRWVKGYTGGDFLNYSKEDSSTQLYQVTNNHAHSWVEVFFPNQGWVSFEPTKGFTNDTNISYQDQSQTVAKNQQPPVPEVKKPEKDPATDTKKVTKIKKSFDIKGIWTAAKSYLQLHWVLTMVGLMILIGLAFGLYRIRGKWVPYFILVRYRFKKKDESFEAAYLILLNQLKRFGLQRKEDQTLSSYARYIDSFFSTREMTRLTKVYEQYLYHQNLPQGTWRETHELWEDLIKKTIA